MMMCQSKLLYMYTLHDLPTTVRYEYLQEGPAVPSLLVPYSGPYFSDYSYSYSYSYDILMTRTVRRMHTGSTISSGIGRGHVPYRSAMPYPL